MSELSSETQQQILVNGEQHEEQQDEASNVVTVEGQITSVSLNDKCTEESVPADMETQVKMQSIFQQVRSQIRSQLGVKAPKSSILELVQKVKDRELEMASVNGEPAAKSSNDKEKKVPEMLTDKCRGEMDLKNEELSAVFEKELESSQRALRDEFKEQISQLRKEMQAYTDQALKNMESKMQSLQQAHLRDQLERKGPDKKPKSSAVPSLASRKGRVLTRTMTTIIPKTCAPVIIGPRAKSETFSSSKDTSSRLLLRDPDFSVFTTPGNKRYQSHRPLPPAFPPLHHRQKLVRTKAPTGS